MPQVLENIIVSAVPEPSVRRVFLTWANGETTTHNLQHLSDKGVFRALRDPTFFARVRVGDHGRSLEWPGELDLCADALWFEAHPLDAPDSAIAATNDYVAKHGLPGEDYMPV
ncbi:DUF2442 domain-containing protein [Rhodopila globiformis]|jgi:hypothetical protein|uniref:DUF2442 domain-containing protein n=1 Tax=Rhodopila globiformis TaxID=1071 RepID=A0A2S6N253_RHOGL|nr:DUF2442 domain-containing protein [Rhodopila globiformis]PPQ28693.1 hypothetical protein CCS01_23650 [Rhodopila globiformis]